MSFADLFVDDELWENNDLIDNHTIIRYMDDTYISILFKEQANGLRDKVINSLALRISDCLYKKLGLRLNPKTRLYDLNQESHRKALESNLKKVSQRHEAPNEENNESAEKKLQYIFTELKNLKRSSIDPYFQGTRELNEETLKAVYDEDVQHMLRNPSVKSHLTEIFLGSGGFDFELTNAYPIPIIILIMACDGVSDEFEKSLLSKPRLTSRDISLTLSYLCQNAFPQSELLDLLKRDPQMGEIMEIFNGRGPASHLLGYFDLKEEQILRINRPHVIEQMRLRVLCEQKGDYSVALNHLLNEIQAICHRLDGEPTALNAYNVKKVSQFLRREKVPHGTQAHIQKLFDQRNKSPVSHADPLARPVTKSRYETHRHHVGECLNHLL